MFTRPRIIPTLLIDDRDLIKTVQFGKRTYLGDPVNAVKIFNRKRIDELSILDIGATKNQREPDYEILKDIASEAFMPLSYGGGITTLDQVHELLKIGYEKVVLNSELIRNPELITKSAEQVGSQSIVASIDVKRIDSDYKCFIADGTEETKWHPVDLAKEAERLGAGELILNSIDNDGMMTGYDIELIKCVSDSVNIPVIAIGGAGGIDDLKKAILDGHAHAAAGGSMFVYYGKLKAVLITAPSEKELINAGIYRNL